MEPQERLRAETAGGASFGIPTIRSEVIALSVTNEGERKKHEIIAIGKAKGFLTDDEVNEHLPDRIVSPALMDDCLSAIAAEGIEIVGRSAADVDAKEGEDDDRYSTAVDPVSLYLRKMGSVPLLTRGGEVEIAKRIEEGERRVLQVVLGSSVAIEEILDLGDKLRAQEIRVKEVVKDADEEDVDFDEQWHIERVCKVIDTVRGLWKEHQNVSAKLDAKFSDVTKKKYAIQIHQSEKGDPGRPPGDAIQEEADR